MKICEYCDSEINDNERNCPHCGAALQYHNMKLNEENIKKPKQKYKRACKKWVSFLLCFYFGVIGAHKLYEGKVGMALIYMFTCGLFLVGWIVDLIVILKHSDIYYTEI